jgi:hypothetical protein
MEGDYSPGLPKKKDLPAALALKWKSNSILLGIRKWRSGKFLEIPPLP